jgi:VanZ family protein
MNMKFFKKYFSKIYFPVAWTLILLILLMLPGNMLPDESHLKIPNLDKYVHICLFGGFVFLWGLYICTRNFSQRKNLKLFFYIFITGIILGITMEYVQKYFIPFRDFELGDIIADMIGCSIAYGVCNTMLTEENDAH